MKRRLLNIATVSSLLLCLLVLLLMSIGAYCGHFVRQWETPTTHYHLQIDLLLIWFDQSDKRPADSHRVTHSRETLHPHFRSAIWFEVEKGESTHYTDERSFRIRSVRTRVCLPIVLLTVAILPACWAWRRLRRSGNMIYLSVPALGVAAALAAMYVALVALPLITRGAVDETTIVGRVAIWVSGILAGTVVARKRWRTLRQRQRSRDGLCLHCGYDLRASSERCPECGTGIPVL